MNIGIIGAGNIGGNLTRRLMALGHRVSVANSRGPETLTELANQTGAIATTPAHAVEGAELVIVTIPEKHVPSLKSVFANVAPDVVVVDTGNYYPQQRDGKIDAIEAGTTESRWVEQQLGHPVIKAFNNIYAEHLLTKGKPKDTPGRIALPISGDDTRAKEAVSALINEIGFDAVDAGSIDDSWRQQPGTPVYGKDFDADGVKRALAEATPTRTEDWKAT